MSRFSPFTEQEHKAALEFGFRQSDNGVYTIYHGDVCLFELMKEPTAIDGMLNLVVYFPSGKIMDVVTTSEVLLKLAT